MREAVWEEQWENRKPHGARKNRLIGHKTASVQASEKAGEGKNSSPAKRGVRALLHTLLCPGCFRSGWLQVLSPHSPTTPKQRVLLCWRTERSARVGRLKLEAPQSLPWPCHTLKHERVLPKGQG